MNTTTPATARTSRSRFSRAIASVVLGAVATVGAMTVTAGPASANPALDYCQHATKAIIGETLDVGNHAGLALDVYLYRWNGSSWAFTGASQRLYGTTGGSWSTASGYMTTEAQFYMARNSGYYLLLGHGFYTANPSGGNWAWAYGYNDDLRGAQTYCLS